MFHYAWTAALSNPAGPCTKPFVRYCVDGASFSSNLRLAGSYETNMGTGTGSHPTPAKVDSRRQPKNPDGVTDPKEPDAFRTVITSMMS